MKITNVKALKKIALEVRKDIIEAVYSAKSGHPGGSLSIADILTVLYFNQMNIDEKRPEDPNRDRLVLSKGHACTALYSVLAEKGYFDKELLKTFRKIGFVLPKKWVIYEDINQIHYPKKQVLRGKKYHRNVEFYQKYKKLPRPVIVDRNNNILDGYNIIIFANDFGIKRIPVIRLDNVIMSL